MTSIDLSDLKSLLDESREKHRVVGATLGVLTGGVINAVASGSLNLLTGVDATPDSAFQIGSISKVFTATLMMQLVDEGRVTLDEPVIRYLPDFVVADPVATRTVTVRQLLNHTSGIDGDFFPADDPEGGSTVSYVRKMCLLPNLYSPGTGPTTYCNAGYVVVGRIIEVLTGRTWQNAVMDRICRPLGMPVAFANPHETLRFRCAMGHISDPAEGAKTVIAPVTFFLPMGLAAAGSALMLSAESLLLFAKAHMDDGAYGGGSSLLSASSARAMRESRVPVNPYMLRGITHWGLGWFLAEGGDYRMAGHDGATIGHNTYLRTFPDRRIAFTLLTNSPSGELADEIETVLLKSLLGVSRIPDPPAEEFIPDPARYVGNYENIATRSAVTEKNGRLAMRVEERVGITPGVKPEEQEVELKPYRRDVFSVCGDPRVRAGLKVIFMDGGCGGAAKFLLRGGRMESRRGN